jgi:hypothetical protein
MNLVLHIVGKDFRRLRVWLLLWLGVVALPMLLGVSLLVRGPFTGDDDWNLPNVHTALLALEGFVAYVLTLILIQEDAVMGTRQFWLTRPISRGRLLAAKTMGAIAMLWLLPIVLSLPWWWWCGFGVRDMAVAAAEWCVLATLVALPAALIASLTDSLARSLLWTMVLVAAVPVLLVFFTAATRTDQPSMQLWISRAIVAVGVIAVEFAVMVTVQFHLRRYSRWLVLAGVLVFATLAGAARAPWALMGRTAPRERAVARAASVEVRFDRVWAEPLSVHPIDTPQGLDRRQEVKTRFIARGIPEGTSLAGMGVTQRWQVGEIRIAWADHLGGGGAAAPRFLGAGLRFSSPEEDDEETRRALNETRKARNFTPRATPALPEGETHLHASAYLRPSVVSRLAAEPTRYDARLWMELVRPIVEFETEFAPGGWQRGKGRAMQIKRVDSWRRSDNIRDDRLLVVETEAASLIGKLRAEAERGAWFLPWWRQEAQLVVVNRSRGEVVGVERKGNARELLVNGVNIRWAGLAFRGPRMIREGKAVPVPGWESGLKLARIVMQPEAVFSRAVTVEELKLTIASPPERPIASPK